MRHLPTLDTSGFSVLLAFQLVAIFYALITGYSPLSAEPTPPLNLDLPLTHSPEPIGDLVEVIYQRTVDGDTIKVSTTEMGEIYSVRLFGVDCEEPKLGTARAFAAALFTAEALENAQAVYLEYDDVALTDHYGRVLAWVWYTPGGTDGSSVSDADPLLAIPSTAPLCLLNLELLDSHHARTYSGTQSKRYQ